MDSFKDGSVLSQCLRSCNSVPCSDEFAHLKMHITSDIDVVNSYEEHLSFFLLQIQCSDCLVIHRLVFYLV